VAYNVAGAGAAPATRVRKDAPERWHLALLVRRVERGCHVTRGGLASCVDLYPLARAATPACQVMDMQTGRFDASLCLKHEVFPRTIIWTEEHVFSISPPFIFRVIKLETHYQNTYIRHIFKSHMNFKYFLISILLFANIDVSRYILIVDIIILMKSNMD
jgi:hypothetical protein